MDKSGGRGSLLGNFSFEGDSFPEFSEFDTTSEVIAFKASRIESLACIPENRTNHLFRVQNTQRRPFDLLRSLTPRRISPEDDKIAPMTIIETITIARPLKVIAFLCGVIVVMLMVMTLTSTDWLLAQGWRQGLFYHCVDDTADRPLPFGLQDEVGCYPARNEAYIRATAALCILTLATAVFSTLLTGLGLRSEDPNNKYKYYRLAVYVMLAALIAVLVALVLYPVCFARELSLGNRPLWEFGWAYGVGWGAAIFLFGAVVLLLCDKESEEIYYKERDIHGDPKP